MAKAPAKRRGITLASNANAQDSPDLFASPQLADAPAAGSGEPPGAESRADGSELRSGELLQQLAELRLISSELDARWRRQTDQMRQQVRMLEEQREQIARQTGRLESLQRMRKTSGRVGLLLTLLSAVSVGALAYHAWPQIQGVAGDWKRLSAGADQMAPALVAMRTHLDGVQSELSEMGGAIQSLQSDLSGVRADLGTLPERVAVAAAPAALTSPGHRGIARNATSLANPFRTRHPGMPW